MTLGEVLEAGLVGVGGSWGVWGCQGNNKGCGKTLSGQGVEALELQAREMPRVTGLLGSHGERDSEPRFQTWAKLYAPSCHQDTVTSCLPCSRRPRR